MLHRKPLTYALVIVGLAGFSAWKLLHDAQQIRVTTATVTDGPVTRQILASGTLQATTIVEVSAEVSGTVESLGADYNSIVRKGQILAQLDPSTLRAQLGVAQAELAQAQADLFGLEATARDASVELKRIQSLSTIQVVAQADLDEATLQSEAAEDAVKDGRSVVSRATAVVHEMEVNVDHATIRSPIDGIVVSRSVDVGQTLVSSMQAQPLFHIAADLKRMHILVDVDQSDVAGLKNGQPATFEVATYPHETFRGILRLVRIEPVVANAQASVVSYTGVVDVDNTDERLRPGMTAEVDFDGPTRADSIRIPNNALSFRPSAAVMGQLSPAAGALRPASGPQDAPARIVWEYDGHTLKPVAVHAGLTDDKWTELVSGPLHPGDQLVVGAVLQRRPVL